MRPYSLMAPAKINLYLEILGDRPDGYHELAMVMQSIALADQVTLRANGTARIQVFCDHPDVPADRTNLAYRAAILMADTYADAYRQFGGVDIRIDKRIPVGAGLAGGSTNAAAVLVGLDLMWGIGATQMELQALGTQLGADVPFCVAGGTAIATGRGEVLSPLPTVERLSVVLAKYQSLSVSTAWAYNTYRQRFEETYERAGDRLSERRHAMQSGALVSAINQGEAAQIGKCLYNDFEKLVLADYPRVAALKAAMLECEPLGCLMSGSGPTVFALTESQEQAERLAADVRTALPDADLKLWVTHLCPNGIQLSTN